MYTEVLEDLITGLTQMDLVLTGLTVRIKKQKEARFLVENQVVALGNLFHRLKKAEVHRVTIVLQAHVLDLEE